MNFLATQTLCSKFFETGSDHFGATFDHTSFVIIAKRTTFKEKILATLTEFEQCCQI